MEEKTKAIIIDDEMKSILTLSKLIEKYCPQIEITGTAIDVKSGVNAVNELKPELVFLDITMPDGDGFDVLQLADYNNFEVIFITASDQFAIKAFEFSALHYLLKPINYKELIDAIRRFEKLRKPNMLTTQVDVLKKSLNNDHEKIILPTSEGLNIIELERIVRCEADDNYTHFYLTGGQKIIVSKTLSTFEKILTDIHFFRIHNKHLINLMHVKQYVRGKGGYVIMNDGSHVYASENKKKEFIQVLKEYARSY
ncbi:MAG: LytTR family DNA-binding domain-containing protein [Bacteroidales bacterium]